MTTPQADGFVILPDSFPEHPQIVEVGPLCFAAYVSALAYCSRNGTGRYIPQGAARTLIDCSGINVAYYVPRAEDDPFYVQVLILEDLERAGLLVKEDAGYTVKDLGPPDA